MVGVTLVFRIEDGQAIRLLGELNQRGRDAQPTMAAIGGELDHANRDRFDEQVSQR
ncbi:MAG: hypothetical protein HLUCCA13_05520 [Halomonas sp. HL-48]|nr:hypothetical protein [Halomonas sp. HL-48]KPQ25487.1 MAG: hypothetical protein HLUCCA13_05520 [Halomonas sp. HL-48]